MTAGTYMGKNRWEHVSELHGGWMQRVVKLRTVAEGRVSGACRCIKFGEGPVDLMAFSEHSSHCHLIDSRAYHERQARLYPPDFALPAGCSSPHAAHKPCLRMDMRSRAAILNANNRMALGRGAHPGHSAVTCRWLLGLSYSFSCPVAEPCAVQGVRLACVKVNCGEPIQG